MKFFETNANLEVMTVILECYSSAELCEVIYCRVEQNEIVSLQKRVNKMFNISSYDIVDINGHNIE